MIDFHSHILPGIDDGSANVPESVALLQMLAAQGVDTVVATPHFYANHESISRFLARRKASFDSLKEKMPADAPNVLLGAEVRYYEGISRLNGLESLCIEGSKLLLLEMPMEKWTEYTIRELIDLSCSAKIRIVLAHIERYWSLQNRAVWDRLLECDLLMQVNASFFNRFGTRRKAIKLLANGTVRLIGSDCHNLTDRAPQIQKAFDRIQRKLGIEFVTHLNDYTHELLLESQPIYHKS